MKRRLFQCLKKINLLCLAVFAYLLFFILFSTPVSGISVSYAVNKLGTRDSSVQINGSAVKLTSSEFFRRYRTLSYTGLINIKNMFYTFDSAILKSPGILTSSFGFYITPTTGDTFSDNPISLRSNPTFPDSSSLSLISSSCSTDAYDPLVKTYSVICDFSAYLASPGNFSNFIVNFDIEVNNVNVDTYSVYVFQNAVSFTQLDYSSLSADDRQWLLNNIADQVEEGQKAANEDVKLQTETESTNAETEANTQGGDSATQGQTLLQAFTGFVSAITSITPASSCSETVDLSGYHPDMVFQVDVCQSPFPSQFSFIGTILLILMVVPLSIFTVRRMIGLFRSFQS